MIAADLKAPPLPSQEEASLVYKQADNRQIIDGSRSAADMSRYCTSCVRLICLNPSLGAAAVLSLNSGVSPSLSHGGYTWFGTKTRLFCGAAAGWRLVSGGGFGGRFGCPSALRLLRHRAALCACAVRALSSEGRSQRGCFLGITSTAARARAFPTRILLHLTWTRVAQPSRVKAVRGEAAPPLTSGVALKRSRAAAPPNGLSSL